MVKPDTTSAERHQATKAGVVRSVRQFQRLAYQAWSEIVSCAAPHLDNGRALARAPTLRPSRR